MNDLYQLTLGTNHLAYLATTFQSREDIPSTIGGSAEMEVLTRGIEAIVRAAAQPYTSLEAGCGAMLHSHMEGKTQERRGRRLRCRDQAF
jgi:hypothetical protein